ncbi:glycosyltransferase family 2 protein [Pseudoramibacter faecis]|uniref:glycosyltransferase family 2 protein n=1 Tax=Pseudoramibacter faecis TaxID=3108534 RepID=UPI002E79EBB1|nr:glycosyltransferase [Pseudoramibacter sp. HA2172]
MASDHLELKTHEALDSQISFIIPVYNGEKTLRGTVESILKAKKNQDDIEVIIVENGSQDGTNVIIEELQQQFDENVLKVFHSEKGVSNARNKGILEARGIWISFVDADDALVENAIDILLRDAQNEEAQLYTYGHRAGDDERPVAVKRKVYNFDAVEAAKAKMISDPTKYMQAWGKLFKRKIILKNNLLFNPELSFAEDSDFTLQYLMHTNRICLCPEIIYQYSLNQNSVMRTFTGEKTQKYLDSLATTKKTVAGAPKSMTDAFNHYILMHLNIIMVWEVFSRDNPVAYGDKLEQMRRITRAPIFHQAIQGVKLWECRSAKMMPILLLKLKQYRLAAQVYRLRARQNAKKEETNWRLPD